MSDAQRATGEKLMYEHHEVGKNFELYEPAKLPTFHADGLAGIEFAGLASRIVFYTTEGTTPDPDPEMGLREKRVVTARVIIPTAQLLEALLSMVVSLQPQLDQIQAAAETQTQFLAAQVERFKSVRV
jgi:hypothetical protein